MKIDFVAYKAFLRSYEAQLRIAKTCFVGYEANSSQYKAANFFAGYEANSLQYEDILRRLFTVRALPWAE